MPQFVDKCVPDRSEYKVHQEYAAILNQTNIGANNNKFYIIQILIKNNKFHVWTRWGRVGENGQNNMDNYDSENATIQEFKKKFKSKTGNNWETVESKSFIAKEGKYWLVEIDTKEDNAGDNSEPMGKLSEAQIEKGQQVLKKLENIIEPKEESKEETKEESKEKTKKKTKKESQETPQEEPKAPPQEEPKPKSKKTTKKKATEETQENLQIEPQENKLDLLQKLSSEFFTLIPTVTGRKKPEPITTIEVVKQKEELLKFYLRMGFEEEVKKDESGLTPIAGVMDLPLMSTLLEAIGKCCSLSDIKSSVKQGKTLADKQAGNPTKPMDQELYGSIMLYTSNAIYKDLNKVLRDENRTGIKKYFNYLRMFFEALDRLPKKKETLWRGISVDLYDQYKVGNTVTWWGVSSCTSDKNVAQNFMYSCGGNCTFLTIETKTATDISPISFYSSEKESLLAPGTQLKVLSSEKKGKITYIHLEEIGRVG